MSTKKEQININKCISDKLGIKIILAKNTKINNIFAIITEVNPASDCKVENVEIGDILYSINGVEIDNNEALNDVIKLLLIETNLVLTIMKKGALDGTDLIQRCINSPCSEICEVWKESTVKLKKRTVLQIEKKTPNFKYSKAINTEEAKSRKTSNGSVEDTLITSKIIPYNNSKIKLHQKAIPMAQLKKHSTPSNVTNTNFIRKTSKTSPSDMIASPKPHFINRPSGRKYNSIGPRPKLTHVKSLSDLADTHTSYSSETASTTSSSTSNSYHKNPTTKIVERPTPMPRKNPKILIQPMTLEPLEFSSLQISTNIDKQSKPSILSSKPNHLNKNLSEQKRVSHHNSLSSYDAPVLPNRSPNRGAYI